LRAKMEKNEEKRRRTRTWTKKYKAIPRDRRKKWRGWSTKVNKKEKRNKSEWKAANA